MSKMKKTNKVNVLKGFNDTKANAVKKANALMSTFKKSLVKAQKGASVSSVTTTGKSKVDPYVKPGELSRQGPLDERATSFQNRYFPAGSSKEAMAVKDSKEKGYRNSEFFNSPTEQDYIRMEYFKKGGSAKRRKK